MFLFKYKNFLVLSSVLLSLRYEVSILKVNDTLIKSPYLWMKQFLKCYKEMNTVRKKVNNLSNNQ